MNLQDLKNKQPRNEKDYSHNANYFMFMFQK